MRYVGMTISNIISKEVAKVFNTSLTVRVVGYISLIMIMTFCTTRFASLQFLDLLSAIRLLKRQRFNTFPLVKTLRRQGAFSVTNVKVFKTVSSATTTTPNVANNAFTDRVGRTMLQDARSISLRTRARRSSKLNSHELP